MPNRTVDQLLRDKFTAGRNVDALVRHFQEAVDEYHQGHWEKSLAKAGKFLEAALKALLVAAGLPSQSGRQFKVDKAINDLGQVPPGAIDDAVRLTLPRCLRFVYDIASNRGGRHDPDEIDPNEMDATAALNACAWALAEMVRYAQRQKDPTEAKLAVDGLMTRKYPFVENIDGHVYFDVKSGRSARELGLLVLWERHPRRMSRDELTAAIRRQRRNISTANARMAVQRLADVVDDDGQGNLRLRGAGLREADQVIEAARKAD